MATFVRVYETDADAADAVRDLKKAGFGASSVLHVTPDTLDPADAAKAAGMEEYASFVADQVALERSVVGVRPPFGQGAVAVKILDAAGPMAVEIPKEEVAAASAKISATPLSDWLGWRVLSDDPTPLSSMFGWRVLSEKAAPFSEWIGWRTKHEKTYFTVSELKDDPTPLSNAVGWRVLSDTAAPLSEKFGWKTKSEKDHFMVSELSDDPTPLSSRLGLKVLSDKQ